MDPTTTPSRVSMIRVANTGDRGAGPDSRSLPAGLERGRGNYPRFVKHLPSELVGMSGWALPPPGGAIRLRQAQPEGLHLPLGLLQPSSWFRAQRSLLAPARDDRISRPLVRRRPRNCPRRCAWLWEPICLKNIRESTQSFYLNCDFILWFQPYLRLHASNDAFGRSR